MTDHTHVDDPAVAAVLSAAAAPAEGPMPGEKEALAVFRSVLSPPRRVRMSRFSEKAKLVAAAVFGGVVVISGAATAATGTLPIVSHGHSHPHPATSHAPDATDDDQGEDTDAQESTDDAAGVTTNATGPDELNEKGSAVSAYVHSLPKGHRGPAVCTLASDGKCKAGQHGQSDATTHGQSGDTHGRSDALLHGKADLPHGQADALTHGKADLPHGQSDALTHGKADASTHGKSAEAHSH